MTWPPRIWPTNCRRLSCCRPVATDDRTGVPGGTLVTPPVTLVVSIDTEEDNWVPTRSGTTVENVRELVRLDRCFERLGVRATYFTTYQVGRQATAAAVLREICDRGAAEIGAHLHPWNTPPLDEPFVARNTMLTNLPQRLQVAKLQSLTQALAGSFGERPRVFR